MTDRAKDRIENPDPMKSSLGLKTETSIPRSKGEIFFLPFFIFLAFVILPGCHQYKVGQMQRPEESGKIRITAFVYSVEEEVRPHVSEDELASKVIRGFIRELNKKDIYEFVYSERLNEVLVSGKPSVSQITANDYSLTKTIGKQAFLDYVVVIIRSLSRVTGVQYMYFMTNVETGRVFKITRKYSLGRRNRAFYMEMWRGIYKELFDVAKMDLAATAIRKKEAIVTPLPLPKDKTVARVDEERPSEIEKKGVVAETTKRKEKISERPTTLSVKGEKVNLVVNDFKAMNLPSVLGLILAEHLRSELLKTDRFRIINRENIKEALKEMGFQMTGVVEETQMANAGKGLGAKKIVSGNVAKLDSLYTLSLKLINIETLETEMMIFERTSSSSEENLFETIHLMAKKMAMGYRIQ
jgi:hypothetical protein